MFLLDYILRFIGAMLELLSLSKKTITNSLNIYIKSNTGSTLSVSLDPKWDIKNVKEVIAPKLGLSPEEVKIIFAGKELEDSIIIEVSLIILICLRLLYAKKSSVLTSESEL